MSDGRQLMLDYLDALTKLDDFARYYTDDVVLTAEGTDQRAVGREAVRQQIRYMHEIAFDARPELRNLLVDADRAVIEADFVGTHVGEFAGVAPAGAGRAVRVPYTVVYDLRDDLISALRIYFPMSLLVEQITDGAEIESAAGGSADLLARVVRLYNAADLEGFADLYAEDAVLVTPDGAREGRAAIDEYWRTVNASFPDATLTLGTTARQGQAIAFEYAWAGTNTGPFILPDGTELPPTGRRVEVRCMDLVQFRDQKLAVHHLYWDNLSFVTQLGLPPDR